MAPTPAFTVHVAAQAVLAGHKAGILDLAGPSRAEQVQGCIEAGCSDHHHHQGRLC